MTTLTPLQVVALAVFAERPQHAYEVLQTLTDRREDRVVKLRTGTLYHAIARLADTGLLQVRDVERAGARPERMVYAITDVGRAALTARLRELLGAPVYEYPCFGVAMSEAHHLAADDVARLLRVRAAGLDEECDALTDALDSTQRAGVPRAFVLDLRWQRDTARHDADWCRALADEIERGEIPWPGSPAFAAQQPADGCPLPLDTRFRPTLLHPDPPTPVPAPQEEQ